MIKRLLEATAAVAMLATATAALAQTPSIAPADQGKLQSWVMQQNKQSASAPAGFSLTVGAIVPQSVQLNPITPDAGVAAATSFNYALLDGKIALVDPSSRRVMQVLGG